MISAKDKRIKNTLKNKVVDNTQERLVNQIIFNNSKKYDLDRRFALPSFTDSGINSGDNGSGNGNGGGGFDIELNINVYQEFKEVYPAEIFFVESGEGDVIIQSPPFDNSVSESEFDLQVTITSDIETIVMFWDNDETLTIPVPATNGEALFIEIIGYDEFDSPTAVVNDEFIDPDLGYNQDGLVVGLDYKTATFDLSLYSYVKYDINFYSLSNGS